MIGCLPRRRRPDRHPRANPLVARRGHFEPRAKSVIFLFMEGGPSHLDLFDPKPLLNELAGQPLPASFGKVITAMGESDAPLLAIQAQMEAVRPVRPLGFRLAAAHGRAASMTWPSFAPAWPTASTTRPASAR